MTADLAPVLRGRKALPALRYAYAEPAALDYDRFAFTPDAGRAFLHQRFSLSETKSWTGRKVLTTLMTPRAAPLRHDLDPAAHDMSLFGRCDADLRAHLSAQGLPVYRFHDALREAFRLGLIYRVAASGEGKTYYGVPQLVRTAFSLKTPSRD
ncbi:MAG: hypothetical protein AAB320_05305 [Elusimicrobiota bacterium]